MAKGKKPAAPAPAKQGESRNNGKAWKKRPKIFDKEKRGLRLMTTEEYAIVQENSRLKSHKNTDKTN